MPAERRAGFDNISDLAAYVFDSLFILLFFLFSSLKNIIVDAVVVVAVSCCYFVYIVIFVVVVVVYLLLLLTDLFFPSPPPPRPQNKTKQNKAKQTTKTVAVPVVCWDTNPLIYWIYQRISVKMQLDDQSKKEGFCLCSEQRPLAISCCILFSLLVALLLYRWTSHSLQQTSLIAV